VRITPDSVGPTAGATATTIVIVPIVAPRRDTGTSRRTDVIRSGTITAVPAACTTRPVISIGKPGASAEMSVPAVNSDMEAM
jgi:hypothetical protein